MESLPVPLFLDGQLNPIRELLGLVPVVTRPTRAPKEQLNPDQYAFQPALAGAHVGQHLLLLGLQRAQAANPPVE
jgi:hypothetical protein